MQIKTPDIGVDKATVADILVKVGDVIAIDDSIVLLESDKASVEVPSASAGVVKNILVHLGDSVVEGSVLIELEAENPTATSAKLIDTKEELAPVVESKTVIEATQATVTAQIVDVQVPDIGVEKATVGEILVAVGDQIEVDQSLILVESDKATVEVPSVVAGTVEAIQIAVGDVVKEGVVILKVKTMSSAVVVEQPKTVTPEPVTPVTPTTTQVEKPATTISVNNTTDKLTKEQNAANAKVYAGPAVRKLARELGVILADVQASGSHARLIKEDLFAYVKTRLTAAPASVQTQVAVASGLPKLPSFDAFGGVEEKELTRLQQVSIPQLSLNNYIPQVTQFDLADITELEAWRNELKANFKKDGISLTIMAFIIKAVAHLLKEEREFAGHLSDDGKSVLLRKEIHMGIAVATPDGLTVPVLRHPDQKSIKQIAIELGELGQKARDKKLSPKDLQGANFTITSLGSIGGTAFTPLVNWPQVAILGISPATMQPVWNGASFDPKLMLPLSLSYDHRVINGADAARFTNKLSKLLQDIRTLLL